MKTKRKTKGQAVNEYPLPADYQALKNLQGDWKKYWDGQVFAEPKPTSHPFWAVQFNNGKTKFFMPRLYPNRRLARMAAGNGKRPWYRAVKVKVIIEG